MVPCNEVSVGRKSITRRDFLQKTGAVLASWQVSRAMADATESRRPNVIVIVADDLGYGQLSCYPHLLDVHTPNIDRIATTGLRMTDGYAADGMCWPSRGSILTGRYHQRWQSRANIPAKERMLGSYLRQAGYTTGCIGKWHNTGSIGEWDGKPENHPFGRGFDEFFGFLGGMHDYFDWDLGTHWKGGRNRPHYMPIYDGKQRVEGTGYLTDVFTQKAVDFVDRNKDEPFLLYLSYNAIHTPLQAPAECLKRFNDGKTSRDLWRAMLYATDRGIGSILDALEGLRLRENTMVWFIGDNGGYPVDPSESVNWRFKGRKGTFYEGGIRIPWLVSWPGVLPQGRDYTESVMHIDVLPTILAAAGAREGNISAMDGTNLLPYWTGKKPAPPHEALFFGDPRRSSFAVRCGDWKLVSNPGRGKLKEDDVGAGLFDLKLDPAEQRNMRAQKPRIAEELRNKAKSWAGSL